VQLNENLDRWTYIWGTNLFSSAIAYKQISGTYIPMAVEELLSE